MSADDYDDLDAPDGPREGEPPCTCPVDEAEWGSAVEPPMDPDCPLHGDDPPSAALLAEAEVEGAQGGGPHAQDIGSAACDVHGPHPGTVDCPDCLEAWKAAGAPGTFDAWEGGPTFRGQDPMPAEEDRTPDESGAIGDYDRLKEDPEGAIQEERSREPGGPPPMPSPPAHDCDPAALEIDPGLGWVCMACGLVLGGDQEFATAAPDYPEAPAASTAPARQEPGEALGGADVIGRAIQVLDPTMIQGPQEFAEQILYMVGRLSQAEYAQRVATHEKTEAKTAYRRAYDLAISERRGQGSADVRSAEARIQCDEQLSRLELAEGVLEAIKDAAHSWRSMISGYQTAARLVGEAYGAQGRYGS